MAIEEFSVVPEHSLFWPGHGISSDHWACQDTEERILLQWFTNYTGASVSFPVPVLEVTPLSPVTYEHSNMLYYFLRLQLISQVHLYHFSGLNLVPNIIVCWL